MSGRQLVTGEGKPQRRVCAVYQHRHSNKTESLFIRELFSAQITASEFCFFSADVETSRCGKRREKKKNRKGKRISWECENRKEEKVS